MWMERGGREGGMVGHERGLKRGWVVHGWSMEGGRGGARVALPEMGGGGRGGRNDEGTRGRRAGGWKVSCV